MPIDPDDLDKSAAHKVVALEVARRRKAEREKQARARVKKAARKPSGEQMVNWKAVPRFAVIAVLAALFFWAVQWLIGLMHAGLPH